jgi:hypothetical protein
MIFGGAEVFLLVGLFRAFSIFVSGLSGGEGAWWRRS